MEEKAVRYTPCPFNFISPLTCLFCLSNILQREEEKNGRAMEFCLAMLLFSALGEMLEELFNYRCEWLSVREICHRSTNFNESEECGYSETQFAEYPHCAKMTKLMQKRTPSLSCYFYLHKICYTSITTQTQSVSSSLNPLFFSHYNRINPQNHFFSFREKRSGFALP